MGYIAVVPPYTLVVLPDRYPRNPREYECFGRIICFSPGRLIGDMHSCKNNFDFFRVITKGTPGASADMGALRRAAERENVILPVYLDENSGLSVSALPPPGNGSDITMDDRQIGWIYATHEIILREFNASKMTPELIEQAKVLLYGEVSYYNSYLKGECYWFELYESGITIAKCSGLLGSLEDVKKEIEDLLPDKCQGITEKLRFVEASENSDAAVNIEKPYIPAIPDETDKQQAANSDVQTQFHVEAKVFPINDPAGVTLAIANIVVDDAIAINGISIDRGSKDFTVSMPKAKDINGRIFSVCAVLTKELRSWINTTVIEVYKSELAKRLAAENNNG